GCTAASGLGSGCLKATPAGRLQVLVGERVEVETPHPRAGQAAGAAPRRPPGPVTESDVMLFLVEAGFLARPRRAVYVRKPSSQTWRRPVPPLPIRFGKGSCEQGGHEGRRSMRRLLGGSIVTVAALILLGLFTGSAGATVPECDEPTALCTEPVDSIGYAGEYTGHDEPSLLFYSNTAGSGNSSLYRLKVPSDPNVLPNQAGTAGTWNFQLHPAFWLGMALCDNQSAPEFTHDPCVPDSDANIFDGTDETAPDYIGKHPGTAFLEVQFYPPGWAPWPPGVSCDASKWCAAMAIFSLNQDQNTGAANNANCLNKVGIEPANFAFITKSGAPHGPPGPLDQTNGTFTPSSATDLFMNSGDELTVDIHDGAAGLTVIIHDLTTGQSGSMTASSGNGFAQVLYEPASATCHESAYSFRPMYSTSSEHTRVPWAAHNYNVAFSDEIGHFEYCN